MAYKGEYRGKPRTREDWREMAVKSHLCTACLFSQSAKWDGDCPKCKAPQANREYMPSRAELNRAAGLVLLARKGQITRLKFHPRYDLKVNGVKVCTYEADAEYMENGKVIVEDTKPEGDFMEETAKLKIALFNALHLKFNIKVRIYRSTK